MNLLPTTKRIIAVENPAILRIERNQLVIDRQDMSRASVQIEDIGVLVLDYAQITVTVPLIAALAEAEVAVIVCGSKHLPVANYLPFASHHQHARIIGRQAGVGEPTKKRVWQQIVQAKIRNQGAALEQCAPARGAPRLKASFARMSREVASGDSGNLEAIAAARYFPAMFGPEFTRQPDQEDLENSMLNYGYALIRAAVTRALCAAGLHPAFGVFHHNRYDPFALADDPMEPLRPIVDIRVKQRSLLNEHTLSPALKRYLYPVLTATVALEGERLPLFAALEKYSANLRRCLLGESKKLHCPEQLQMPD